LLKIGKVSELVLVAVYSYRYYKIQLKSAENNRRS
jgi:hypothetical protein